jgi:hypothetical protein
VATSTWTNNYLTAGSHLYSTYLANTVDTYTEVADRITYGLGYPIVNLELHGHQIFTNITLAVEMFSKFAGYTLEHLVVDSTKYTLGKGLDISKLFLLTPELTATYTDEIEVTISQDVITAPTSAADFSADDTRNDPGAPANEELARWIPLFAFDSDDTIIDPSDYTFVMTLDDGNASVEKAIVLCLSSIDTTFPSGSGILVELTPYGSANTTANDMFTISSVPGQATEEYPPGAGTYSQSVSIGIVLKPDVTQGGQINGTRNITVNDSTVLTQLTALRPSIGRWDSLTRQNRKVIDVFSYDESMSSSLNTLFTIEQTLAQQTYFSYAMGNYGFDLISWYILKQWLETREKMLSTKRYFKFNERNQHLMMIPEPRVGEKFYGVMSCYVEKHIKDLVKEPWVQQYALALTKITLGRVRGKFGSAQLFGGTSLDTSILAEGIEEKKTLEDKLYTGSSPGFGDAAPPMFFVG